VVFLLTPKTKTLAQSQNFCTSNLQCTDDFTNTNDVCVGAGTTDAYCTHNFSEPVNLCYGLPKDLANDSSGIANSVQIIDRNFSDFQFNSYFQTLKNQGKMMIANANWKELARLCDMNPDASPVLDISPMNVDDCTSKITANLNLIFVNPYDGLAFDEFLSDAIPNFYEAVAKATKNVKQTHPKAMFMIWGANFYTLPTQPESQKAASDLMRIFDYYIPEIYNSDNNLIDESLYRNTVWERLFENWQTVYANGETGWNLQDKILIGWAASDTEYLNYDLNPQRDFRENLDTQFRLTKEKINQGKTDGTAIFTCAGTSPETNSWLRMLISHYFTSNNNNDFSSEPIELSYLKNGGFEDTISGDWQMFGIWMIKNVSDLGIPRSGYATYPKIPEKNRVLSLTKGSNFNAVTQTASLTPEKNYYLEVYSKKMSGDFGPSGIKTQILGPDSQPIDAIYRKRNIYPSAKLSIYGTDTNVTLETCRQTVPSCNNHDNLWTKEEFIFRAPSNSITVNINDENAAVGDENIVDFVELQPYEIPLLFKKANKTSAKAQELINFDLYLSSNFPIYNSTISDTIPTGTSFIPGSPLGNFDGSNVTWKINQLMPLNTQHFTFGLIKM